MRTRDSLFKFSRLIDQRAPNFHQLHNQRSEHARFSMRSKFLGCSWVALVNHIQQPAAGTNEYALIDSPAQTRNTCAPRLKRSVLLQTREVLVAKNALILETNAKSRARGVHVKSMKDL